MATDDSRCYDCIIVGAGLSGLQCARSLIDDHGLDARDVLVLEAQDYVGGRVKQNTDFVKGVKIDLGAEIVHGDNTVLTKLAKDANEKLFPAYCWAQGDGGPFETHVNGYYGLYYIGHGNNRRLLRYDSNEPEFVRLNQALKDIGDLDDNDIDESISLTDFLKSQNFSADMISLAAAGFANTFCSIAESMSFKQAVRYTRLWHGNDEDEGEFRFTDSYACVINHLKKGLQIKLNQPADLVDYSKGYYETITTNFRTALTPSPSSSPTPSEQNTETSENMREMIYVTTKDGTVYKTRTVVVSSSPKVLLSNLIKFNPPLPEAKVKGLQSIDMHRAIKVIMKFKKRPWPENLQGIIMSADTALVPEMWFKTVPSAIDSQEKIVTLGHETYFIDGSDDNDAVCIATGFATAKYADKLLTLPEDEMYRVVLAQMDEVFSHITPSHMSATPSDEDATPESLPTFTNTFIKGMFHDWKSLPYIGGGYSCARVGWNVEIASAIAEQICQGRSGAVIFAGEATNVSQPGGTAHAALETGLRAADEVSGFLDLYFNDE